MAIKAKYKRGKVSIPNAHIVLVRQTYDYDPSTKRKLLVGIFQVFQSKSDFQGGTDPFIDHIRVEVADYKGTRPRKYLYGLALQDAQFVGAVED